MLHHMVLHPSYQWVVQEILAIATSNIALGDEAFRNSMTFAEIEDLYIFGEQRDTPAMKDLCVDQWKRRFPHARGGTLLEHVPRH